MPLLENLPDHDALVYEPAELLGPAGWTSRHVCYSFFHTDTCRLSEISVNAFPNDASYDAVQHIDVYMIAKLSKKTFLTCKYELKSL